MSEPCTRCRVRQELSARAENGGAGTSERQTSSPARLRAGATGSGGAGHALDSTGVIRSNDRGDGRDGLVAHGAETQDERNQGEHLNLEIWIAAAQHAVAKWLRNVIAANAIGSIVIAGNERTTAFWGPVGINQLQVRHG